MKSTRLATAALLSLLLVAPSFAGTTAPLAPGKPVGTKDAALLAALGTPLIAIGGFAALAAILATTVGQGQGSTSTATGTGA